MPDNHLSAPTPDSADRDRVVTALSRLFAEDRITQADLEVRLERVYRATTGAELAAIVADLPEARAETPGTVLPAAQRVGALLSGVERRVTGVVPRELSVRSRLGYVELDLRKATFEPGVTVIDVRALMGYVEVRLPAGVRVESHGRALAGFFAVKGASAPNPSAAAPVVRITGRAILGYAECTVGSGEAATAPPPLLPRSRE